MIKLILINLILSTTLWAWNLERVKLTDALATQIDGVRHEINFGLINIGPSMVSDLYIDIREVYRTPGCGINNWRKSQCSRSLFRKNENIFPKQNRRYRFPWIVNSNLTSYMVFRFVDKIRKIDKAHVVRIFKQNSCNPYIQVSGFYLDRSVGIAGKNIQSEIYDRALVNIYEKFGLNKKEDFLLSYYQKGPNAPEWINMAGLAGIRAIAYTPNPLHPAGYRLYPLVTKTPITLYGYDPAFAVEYNIIDGMDRQMAVYRNKKGKIIYTEVLCYL